MKQKTLTCTFYYWGAIVLGPLMEEIAVLNVLALQLKNCGYVKLLVYILLQI
jgi:hypothetical protein